MYNIKINKYLKALFVDQ